MLKVLTGMMVVGALGESAAQRANASAYKSQAEEIQKSNQLNERMEAKDAISALSERRAFEASSGLTDTTGAVRRRIYTDYLQDKAVRKYNADVEAGSARSEARTARLRSGTSMIGGLGGALMTYNRLKTPKEKEANA